MCIYTRMRQWHKSAVLQPTIESCIVLWTIKPPVRITYKRMCQNNIKCHLSDCKSHAKVWNTSLYTFLCFHKLCTPAVSCVTIRAINKKKVTLTFAYFFISFPGTIFYNMTTAKKQPVYNLRSTPLILSVRDRLSYYSSFRGRSWEACKNYLENITTMVLV